MKNKKTIISICIIVAILTVVGVIIAGLKDYGEFCPRDLKKVEYQDNLKAISSENVVEYNRDKNTFTTKDASMPEFAIDYPNTWRIKSENLQSDYEWDVLQNDRGVEISYYSLDLGFGSQYYGGNKVMDYVHITRVCDADFVPADFNGQSYAALGKYVVAKLKVYAYEDGMSEDGEVQYDGATYYAVIPESHLGDDGFCGTGYWAVCASEYVRPMVVLADSPDGTFTVDEESEVIQILKSFRIK